MTDATEAAPPSSAPPTPPTDPAPASDSVPPAPATDPSPSADDPPAEPELTDEQRVLIAGATLGDDDGPLRLSEMVNRYARHLRVTRSRPGEQREVAIGQTIAEGCRWEPSADDLHWLRMLPLAILATVPIRLAMQLEDPDLASDQLLRIVDGVKTRTVLRQLVGAHGVQGRLPAMVVGFVERLRRMRWLSLPHQERELAAMCADATEWAPDAADLEWLASLPHAVIAHLPTHLAYLLESGPDAGELLLDLPDGASSDDVLRKLLGGAS